MSVCVCSSWYLANFEQLMTINSSAGIKRTRVHIDTRFFCLSVVVTLSASQCCNHLSLCLMFSPPVSLGSNLLFYSAKDLRVQLSRLPASSHLSQPVFATFLSCSPACPLPSSVSPSHNCILINLPSIFSYCVCVCFWFQLHAIL